MSCDIHSHNAAAADILVVANDIMEQWKFIWLRVAFTDGRF